MINHKVSLADLIFIPVYTIGRETNMIDMLDVEQEIEVQRIAGTPEVAEVEGYTLEEQEHLFASLEYARNMELNEALNQELEEQ
jgi:hypothetical protein